jgi:hypothetical protein
VEWAIIALGNSQLKSHDCVTRTDTDEGQNQVAIAQIALCVELQWCVHLVDAQTAKEVWEQLEKEYTDKGQWISLKRCLIHIKYEDFSPMASCIEAVTSVAQQFNEIGHPVDNEELAVIMLCGLPDSFDPLIKSIAVNYKDKLSSKDVRMTLLLDEYWWTKAACEGASIGGDSALAAEKLDKKTFFEPVCHHCKKPGHIRPKCPELRKRKKPEWKQSAKLKTIDDSLLLATAFSSMCIKENDGMLDCGCTGHVSGHEDCMCDYLTSEDKGINIANSERLVCKGQGNVKVIIDGNVEKTITDVMHVPDISFNLLSVSKLAEKGFILIFDKHECRVCRGLMLL